MYFTDPVTGELCRVRPDKWLANGVIADVKTTNDASPEGFVSSLHKWRYHVQHPFYLDGINTALDQMEARGEPFTELARPKSFVFLAVEKTARVVDGQAFGVGVYMLDAESVDIGRQTYRAQLNSYAACRKSGKWPGYGDRIQPIALPAWFIQRSAEKLAG